MSDDSLDPRRAARLARAAQAAQVLSDTLWEALHEELGDPHGERVTELSEQLGAIVAIVASLVRAEGGRAREAEVEQPAEPEMRVASPVTEETPFKRQQARDSAPSSPLWGSVAMGGEPSPAVLVDELAPRTAPTSPVASTAFTAPAAAAASAESVAPTPFATSPAPDAPESYAPETHAQGTPRIEIRDVRGGGGPTAWIGSIGRQLECHRQDGSPFAVLLVELVGIERLRQAESSEELHRLTSQVERALARGLRPADLLTRESPGRYWLLAPQTDVTGAQLLAERIARAVRSSAGHRGSPLEVAVGIAVCPEDGRQASELAAHADLGLYAARATGRSSVDRVDR